MSLHLDFEPHSWYMGYAIKRGAAWDAYAVDGNSGYIIEVTARRLSTLKRIIREHHLKAHNGYGERIAKRRLEQIRREILAERVSLGELAELEALTSYIQPDDTLLLEWAGVPECKYINVDDNLIAKCADCGRWEDE